MKKLLCCLLILPLVGCANIMIPSYIQDRSPYQRMFYGSFDKVYATTVEAFNVSGWAIEKEVEPQLFERERALGGDDKQTLLFTEIRHSYFFIGSKYARINVYLRETAANETEVEIRYVKVTSLMFKSLYGYRNDRIVDRIFQDIEAGLDL